MKIAFTAEAERDLESIADYIARDNPARAITFLHELRRKCFDLIEMPQRFPLVQRYERLAVRRRLFGNYLIFYRIEPDQVTVLHILHGAADYASILYGDAASDGH